MHFKYSSLLNIVFVTFMYGFGIPLLFPVAGIAILILYLVEKTMLFYAYRLPPMYDEKLAESVIGKLRWAPLLYLSFGFWMASNHQLLSNEYAGVLEKKSSPRPSMHTIDEYFGFDDRLTQTPAWPLMVALLIMLFCFAFGNRMLNFLMACVPAFRFGNLDDIEEEIDSYWNVLR